MVTTLKENIKLQDSTFKEKSRLFSSSLHNDMFIEILN